MHEVNITLICLFLLSSTDTSVCSKLKPLGKSHSASHIRAEMGFEWSGVFETPLDMYMWSAQKVDGKYADTTMKLVALPALSSTRQALDDLSEKAQVNPRLCLVTWLFKQRCVLVIYEAI
jgi:hypothetical protein